MCQYVPLTTSLSDVVCPQTNIAAYELNGGVGPPSWPNAAPPVIATSSKENGINNEILDLGIRHPPTKNFSLIIIVIALVAYRQGPAQADHIPRAHGIAHNMLMT